MAKRRRKKDRVKNPYGNADDTVFRNIEDPIVNLYRRKNGNLSEQQFAAACKYRSDYLTVGGQWGLAIDYTVERVDTSGRGEPISDRQVMAAQSLSAAFSALSAPQKRVVLFVVGQFMTIAKCAYTITGSRSRHHQREAKRHLIEGLDALAEHYGYTAKVRTTRPRSHRWHTQFDAPEGIRVDWEVYVGKKKGRD